MARFRRTEGSRPGLGVGLFTNAYRPVISGVVNCVDLTRKELLRQGHHPYVFTPKVRGYQGGPAGIFRFPSINLSRLVRYPLPIPFSWRILRQMSAMGLHVLHTHHPFLLGHLAYAYAATYRLPLVYTFHTQYEQYSHYVNFHQPTVKALTRWAVLHFARRCDLIIAPSPTIADFLRELGIKTWTVTLQNAIDTLPFAPRPGDERQRTRARLGIPQDALLAIYAGRVTLEKNLDFLLQAFQPVVRRAPQAHLLIVGDGPQRSHLEKLAAKLEIGSRLTFVGRVDYNHMPELYRCADFFAMASVTEVKPLVVLEAMAAGLPVVAVAACGTADTITHEKDGLLCEARREALTHMLLRALEEPLHNWSQGALQTAATYNIAPYTARLVELYQEARERLR